MNARIALSLLLLAPWTIRAQQTTKLDTTSFVVLGEGLAAGMASFGLQQDYQKYSFPAQMARQMGTAFPQPLFQGPGIGEMLGAGPPTTGLPSYPQTRVRVFPSQARAEDEGPTLFVFNLSVPGMKLADSVARRPVSPLVHRDPQQTAVNLVLGFPALILDQDVPLWTQLEYAQSMAPTLALVELGYWEALEAATAGDPGRMPSPAAFRAAYTEVVQGLRAMQAQVVVTTIPDPMDTAYFSRALTAANILRTPSFVVLLGYGITVEDYVTRDGLTAMGNQLFRRKIEALPPGSILKAATAAEIRSRVAALNTEISNIAREQGALVYDLNAFFRQVRNGGVRAGSSTLTADYFGGFYSLDGYYPGPTGHAFIANEILALLNRTYGRSFPAVDVGAVVADDPVAQYKIAEVPVNPASEFGFSEEPAEPEP